MSLRLALALPAILVAAPLSAQVAVPPYLLDGLVVTASPTPRAVGEVARAVTILEGDELRTRGVTLLSDALRDVPGLTVVRGGSFGAVTSVFLRGGESDHVQVLVDGVQVNSPGGAFDWASLTLDNVERVEIIRGPASALYGSDAMAGVVHVITRTGQGSPRGALALRGGSFGRQEAALTVSGGDGTAGWSLGVLRLRMDGIYPVNSGFENRVVTGNVRLAPDARTRASVALRVSDRNYRFPTDGTGRVGDENSFTFGDEVSASVTAARRVLPELEIRGSVALARIGSGTDDQADGAADTIGFYGFTSLDQVERATVDLRAHLYRGAWVGTVGAEMEEQGQRSFSESLSQWGPSVGRSEYERWNRAVFAHLTGTRGSASFAAGGRMEDNERFGRSATWNADVGWHPVPTVRLRASAGVAIKEPTFFENFAQGWVTGNPALAPERARSVEVGGEVSSGDGRGLVRITAFEQRFRDLIQYVAAPAVAGDPNYANVAEASSRGVELGGEARLGSVRLSADWTWLDTEVLAGAADDGPESDFAPGWRLLRRPEHTVQVGASWAWRDVVMTARARMVGEREDRDFASWPAQRVALPRYTTMELGLDLPVRTWMRLGIRGENLLDARYEEVVGFPAPGRSLSVGGRVSVGGRRGG